MSTNSTTVGTTFSGLTICRERVELRIGHRDDADVRVDRAERIVLGRNFRGGERVEQRRFTDVRQSDDAALDAHELLVLRLARVQAILGTFGALLEQDGQEVGGFAQIVACSVSSAPPARFEHVIDDFLAAAARLRLVARMADAEAQSPELRPDVLDDAADAVVPGAAAVEAQLHSARRQVELVVGDEHVLGRNLVVVDGRAHGWPLKFM